MAPNGHIVTQVSQPTQAAASTVEEAAMRRPAEIRKLWISLATAEASVLTSTSALGPAAEPQTNTPSAVVSVARFLRSRISMKPSSSRSTFSTEAMRSASVAGTMPVESTTRSGRSSLLALAVMSSTSITGWPCSSNCTLGGVPRRNSTPARRASRYQFS